MNLLPILQSKSRFLKRHDVMLSIMTAVSAIALSACSDAASEGASNDAATSDDGGLTEVDGGIVDGGITPTDDRDYATPVAIPSCDSEDALRISTVGELSQIGTSSHRVYCIAAGDYRSYGKLAISGNGGTADAPKVIRFESAEFSDNEEIFTADLSKLARMPQIDIRNTENWVLHRLAFVEVSGQPIRIAGANNIVVDRIRLENNRNGIELQHGTNDSWVQNSYIGSQVIPKGAGNDGVCVAFIGHYYQALLDGDIDYSYPVVAANNHIVNNEIFNCNDGIQAVWMPQFEDEPDFHGMIIAGNDIYIDDRVRTDCDGTKDPDGACAFTENAIDLKAGSLVEASPVKIFDNRMWGWRKTDSNYNNPANSWGTAISTHFSPVQNVEIYNNIIWDVSAALGFTRGAKDSIVRDNIIADVTAENINSGIALVVYSDPEDYDEPGDYGNVSGMTINGNHFIGIGGAWISTSAEDSNITCNVVANADWTATSGPWANGLTYGENTYYNTNSGALGTDTDMVHDSFASSNMGEFCFTVKEASVAGGEEVCLPGVLHAPNSPNACASDYWTTEARL